MLNSVNDAQPDQQDDAAESPEGGSAATPSAASEYAYERSPRGGAKWKWNGKLAALSASGFAVAGALAAISYFYNSTSAASTFLSRAEIAAEEGDYAEQSKWLGRYSLLHPNDSEVIYKVAIAADRSVSQAKRERQIEAIVNARRQIAGAIARMGDDEPEKTAELRRLLITRLLQMGPAWADEAEREIIALKADEGDPQVTDWLGQALFTQLEADTYRRRTNDVSRSTDFWQWLANQPPGQVLSLAVDRNPQDLMSIGRFLSAYLDHPDQFGEPVGDDQSERLTSRIDRSLETLRADPSSRAQLMLSQFLEQNGDAEEFLPVLTAAAEAAAKRIDQVDLTELQQETEQLEVGEVPQVLWDYIVVGEAARKLADTDPDQAQQWYEQLMDSELPVPSGTATQIYVNAGILQQVAGDIDAAIEIWQRGLDEVSDESLELLGRVASARTQKESDERADESVQKFREAVQSLEDRVRSLPEGQITAARRSELNRLIDSANWQVKRMEGYLARGKGDALTAIEKLQAAVDDPAEVDTRERILVARQLAALLGDQGAWDQAAAALDTAVELAPGDLTLRAAAAEAFARAGNQQRAVENWRVAGGSSTLATQVSSAQALFDAELREPPDRRDFSGVRSAVDQIRRGLPDAPDRLDEPEAAAAFRTALARLELLKAFLPETGVAVEEYLASDTLAEQINAIAKRYPDIPSIQAFAATRMAAMGRSDDSQAAIDRLVAMGEPASLTLTLTRAQVLAAAGDLKAAAEFLLEAAGTAPESSTRLLQAAAEYAIAAGEAELAYQAFTAIPEDQRNLQTLFRLVVTAASLPEDSQLLTLDGKSVTPADLTSHWQSVLAEREGEQGSYTPFLKAAQLIAQLRADPNPIERDDPRLREANQLISDVLTRRPNWGQALAMQGTLSAIEGRGEEAVDQLRAAIAAGDGRNETRLRLWDELTKLGRYDEADREIQAASYGSGNTGQDFTELRITLAQRQDDFLTSVELAESAVRDAPDDFRRWVMFAKTATVAARDTESTEEREALIEKANRAIKKAFELAGEDQAEIYEASIGLRLVEGDQQAIRAELKKLKESSLEPYAKYVLQARALQLLGRNNEAIAIYQAADKANPSLQTKLPLAELYRNLRRPADEARVLSEALQLAPENARIANGLARALVARDGQNVNWDEVGKLLSERDRVTPSNRFAYAVLLLARGDDTQKFEALTMLRELFRERNSSSDDAGRALTSYLRGQIFADGDEPAAVQDPEEKKRLITEIRSLYDYLVSQPTPVVGDLFGYASFLIEVGDPKDRLKIESLGSDLRSIDSQQAWAAALEVEIRQAVQAMNEGSIPEIVQDWYDEAMAGDLFKEATAASVAGTTLIRRDFTDEGIEWLARAYKADPAALELYASALRRAERFDECIELCLTHWEKNQDVISAILLAQTLTAAPGQTVTPEQKTVLDEALKKYDEQGALLEAVATLWMRQEEYGDAIRLYQQALAINPARLSALNNLAMALSEVPGRAAEGLAPINRAIEIAGEVPELLDTKGVLLMKSNRYGEAARVFQQALEDLDEPRYRFHLIVTLLAQNKTEQAKAEWESLDLERLDPFGLTPAEQVQLNELKQRFGARI